MSVAGRHVVIILAFLLVDTSLFGMLSQFKLVAVNLYY